MPNLEYVDLGYFTMTLEQFGTACDGLRWDKIKGIAFNQLK